MRRLSCFSAFSGLLRPLAILALGLLAGPAALAQVPTLTGLSPTRNQRHAAASTNVALTFSTPMQNTTATQQAVRVFSHRRGGRMFGTTRGVASVSGSTITFDPTNNFQPGETVYTTVTTAATSTGGSPLAAGKVQQFTVAVGGFGQGTFLTGTEPAVGSNPTNIASGDVDGDGDLDLVTANLNNDNVSVRLNGGDATGSNTGVFSGGSDPAVGDGPRGVAMGDVDGDLDLRQLELRQAARCGDQRADSGRGHRLPAGCRRHLRGE